MANTPPTARSRRFAIIAGILGLVLLGGGIAAFAAQTLGALAQPAPGKPTASPSR